MTYTELVAAIQSFSENNFPDITLSDGSIQTTKEQMDLIIRQAEQRIYNSVQFPSVRKNMIGNIQSGNKYLKAPDDFLSVYSMAVITGYGTSAESYTFLLNKDVNFIREAYPTPNSTGTPKYYALFGPAIVSSAITNELTFILGPTPITNVTVELHFYYYPESIVTTATSWLGDNFDSVLLYGALVEATTFMKGETEMTKLYVAKYTEALQLAKRLGDGLERMDSYRNGQARVVVQ